MAEPDRTKYLSVALLVVGLIFIIGIYPSPSSGRRAGPGTLPVIRITSR